MSISSSSPFCSYTLGQSSKINNFAKIINELYHFPDANINKLWYEQVVGVKYTADGQLLKLAALKKLFKAFNHYKTNDDYNSAIERWFGINIFEKLLSLVAYYLIANNLDSLEVLCENLDSHTFNVERVFGDGKYLLANKDKEKLHPSCSQYLKEVDWELRIKEESLFIDSQYLKALAHPFRYSKYAPRVEKKLGEMKAFSTKRYMNSMETLIMHLIYIICYEKKNIELVNKDTYEGILLYNFLSNNGIPSLIREFSQKNLDTYSLIFSHIPQVTYSRDNDEVIPDKNEILPCTNNIYTVLSYLFKVNEDSNSCDYIKNGIGNTTFAGLKLDEVFLRLITLCIDSCRDSATSNENNDSHLDAFVDTISSPQNNGIWDRSIRRLELLNKKTDYLRMLGDKEIVKIYVKEALEIDKKAKVNLIDFFKKLQFTVEFHHWRFFNIIHPHFEIYNIDLHTYNDSDLGWCITYSKKAEEIIAESRLYSENFFQKAYLNQPSEMSLSCSSYLAISDAKSHVAYRDMHIVNNYLQRGKYFCILLFLKSILIRSLSKLQK